MRSASFGNRFGVLMADGNLVHAVGTSPRKVSDLSGCCGNREDKTFVAGR